MKFLFGKNMIDQREKRKDCDPAVSRRKIEDDGGYLSDLGMQTFKRLVHGRPSANVLVQRTLGLRASRRRKPRRVDCKTDGGTGQAPYDDFMKQLWVTS